MRASSVVAPSSSRATAVTSCSTAPRSLSGSAGTETGRRRLRREIMKKETNAFSHRDSMFFFRSMSALFRSSLLLLLCFFLSTFLSNA